MKAEYMTHMGDDLMVANVARVSMGKRHETFEEGDARLIHYLASNGHWSPFSHPKVQLRLAMPIFVARQWEKHRVGVTRGYELFDQNEISRRYVSDDPEFYTPEKWRAKPEGSIKQGSGCNLANQTAARDLYAWGLETALACYKTMLAGGVAPEQARMILPQSMYTQWVETGSLMYWSRLCLQRLDTHAQYEIRHLAQQVDGILRELFPVSWLALQVGGDK